LLGGVSPADRFKGIEQAAGKYTRVDRGRRAGDVSDALREVGGEYHASRFSRYGPLAGALAVIALVGVSRLPEPLYGDPALFALGAKEVAHGSTLYRDWWDFKQPGIFVVYLVAGEVFGYTAIGLHVFGLVVQLLVALVVGLWAVRRFGPWLGALFPLLAVGLLFVTASDQNEYLMVEGLIGIVIFGGLVLADPTVPSRHHTLPLVGAGVLAGTVVLFKLTYGLLPLAFWAVGSALLKPPEGWAKRRRYLSRLAGGALVPLLVFLVWSLVTGAVGDVWYAFVEFPRAVVRYSPESHDRTLLVKTFKDYGVLYAPVIALAVVGLWSVVWPWPPWRRGASFVDVAMVTWLLGGIPLVIAQLWFPYHAYLLAVPTAYLCVVGVREVSHRWWPGWGGVTKVAVVAAVAVLALGPVRRYGKYVSDLADHGFAIERADRERFQLARNTDTALLEHEDDVLERLDPGSGDIFAWGNPYLYLVTGRLQHGRINGDYPEQLVPKLYDEWIQMIQSNPPRALFVQSGWWRTKLPQHSPKAWEAIQENYQVASESPAGTWYVLRGA
jgi:hypothetical protein